MNKKKCIFCNTILSGNRSNEHIFPQWLLDHLQIRDAEITPTHFSRSSGKAVSTRKHTADDLLAGRICERCNSGWMSDLENEVKSNIVALISAEKEVVDLSGDERIALARWAAKTAYLLNFASNYHKNVPDDHYSYLYSHDNSLPNGVTVLAQQHHGKLKFYWLQQAEWVTYTDESLDEEIAHLLESQSYKITLQFGKLILLVAYLPHPSLKFILWRGIHVPLWPHHGPVASYDRENFPWYDSIEAVVAFHSGLQVASQPGM